MTNIAFIGYRDWSINILRKLARKTKKDTRRKESGRRTFVA